MSYDPHAAIIEQRIQRAVAARIQSMRLDIDAELEQRAQAIRTDVRAEYEHRLREVNDAPARWRVQACLTHTEWDQQRLDRGRRNREASGTLDARPRKQGNTFTITHGRTVGRSGGRAVGPNVWVRIIYRITGEGKADVRRNLDRCLRDADAELVGDAAIEGPVPRGPGSDLAGWPSAAGRIPASGANDGERVGP